MEGFIKLDYTGKTEEGEVFDTTIKSVAAKAGLDNNGRKWLPRIIKIGEYQILPGLDKHLSDLSIGHHKIVLSPEDAFGKKSAKLLKLVPTKVLKQNKIMPYVGQVLDIDGARGIVRVASGGRTIVDFNHPLAGKKVEYDIEIIKQVTDAKEQAEGMLELMGIIHEGIKLEDNKIIIALKEELANPVKQIISEELSRLLEKQIVIEKGKA